MAGKFLMNHTPIRGRIVGTIAAAALLVGLTPRVVNAQAQEKWQADLVITSGNGSPMNFPNDFVENPVTDELLVADSYNNRVLRYAATTTVQRTAGDYLGEITGLNHPYGIAVDASGNIVVLNTGIYTAADDLIQVWSPYGSAELFNVRLSTLTGNALSQPYRIKLAPGTILDPPASATGTVYMVDGGTNQVIILSMLQTSEPRFHLERQFGGGSGDELAAPTGLAVDAAGRIYVSDPNNQRVQIFENPSALAPEVDPAVIASICGWGPPCTIDTTLDYPFGVAIDANGRLLVADSVNNRVAVFSSFDDGLQPVDASIGVSTTGVSGPVDCDPTDAGNVCLPDFDPADWLPLPNASYLADLQGPTNIELDRNGHLLIADSANMRVQRFVQPPMTVSATVAGGTGPGGTFLTGNIITVTVVASTTEAGGLTNVTPNATGFTGPMCGAGLPPVLVTTIDPQSYQVGAGAPAATAPAVPLALGSPVTFAMTFTATSASGPLVFSAGATGTLGTTTTSAQQTLEAVAVNISAGGDPATTLTYTGTLGDPVVDPLPGDLGWFIGQGPDAPVMHLSGNADRIDWSLDDQNQTHAKPNVFQSVCASSLDVPIPRPGHIIFWYRSWLADGRNDGWKKVTVHWSAGPSVDLVYAAPNANGWHNANVVVDWTASDTVSGVAQVDWTGSVGSGIVGGTSLTTTGSFTIPNEGIGLTATVTATSNAGISSQTTAEFKIDSTLPVVSASHEIYVRGASTPTLASANGAGWYNTYLDVVFSGTDNLSGFPVGVALAGDNLAGRKTAPMTNEGNDLTAGVTFTDLAGNSSDASVPGIKIDATKPVVTVPAAVSSETGASFGGQDGWLDLSGVAGTVGAKLNVTASDLVSGVKTVCYDLNLTDGTTCTEAVLTGGVYPVTVLAAGITSGSIWAIDNADNQTAAVSFTLKINRFAPVMTPGTLSQTTAEDAALIGTAVTATDGDGDDLTYTFPAVTANGVLTNVDTATGGYTYTPAPNFNGVDTFSVSVTDGKSAAPTSAIVTISVTAVNDAPAAGNDSCSTDEDTPLISGVTVLANDSDADGDTLTAVLVSTTTHGALTLNADGSFTYAPAANYNGSDNFTYKATGGAADSNDATVTITVNAVNDAPVAADDAYTVAEDGTLAIAAAGVLANDMDVEGTTLAAVLVSTTSHGALTLNANGSFTYAPAANYNGSDSFTYKASDGTTDSILAATVTIEVNAANDAPVANDDAATVAEGGTVTTVNVLANDTDADTTLTFAMITGFSQGAHGSVTSHGDGTFTYAHDGSETTSDSFTYTINDGEFARTATMNVTVTAANDAPVANDDAATVAEGGTVTTVNVLANDTDADTTLTAALITGFSQGAHGSVTSHGDGTFTYTHDGSETTSDSFTYTINDGEFARTATVNVTVTAANDAPVANDDAATVAESGTVTTVNVLANDTDADTTLTAALITGFSQGAHGSVTSHGDGTFTYTHDGSETANDSLTYTINDGEFARTATVNVTVTPVNDAPVAEDQTVVTNEDIPKLVTLGVTDPDHSGFSHSIVTSPAHGSLSGTAPDLTYTPTPNYNGPDRFTFRANDGALDSNLATVTITVTELNDAPVANGDTLEATQGTAVTYTTAQLLGNDTDAEGSSLTIASVTSGTGGTALLNGDGTVTFTPAVVFSSVATFSYTATDGVLTSDTATVTVNVAATNNAPVAANQTVATDEDSARLLTLGATDAEGSSLTYTIVSAPANGLLTGTAPDLTYTPAANYNGSDSFTFKANDGVQDGNVATVAVTIRPVNDAPVAVDDAATVVEDSGANAIAVLVNDNAGPDTGETLEVTAVTQGTYGSVTFTTTGVSYTPAANNSGPDSFTYTIGDRNGGSATAAVMITVSAVNDVPVAEDQTVLTNEDTAVSITLVATDENPSLLFELVSQPAHGSLTGTAPALVYTPTANYDGSDSFTFRANDGALYGYATVTITANAVNDTPSFTAGPAQTVTEDAGAVTVQNWATNISAGPANEAAQLLNFIVSNDNAAVFSVPPAIAADGTLSYTTAANANGAATVTARLHDDGGGADTSLPQTFTITITAVNDAPVAANQTVVTNEDTAQAITLGATDAEGSSLTYTIVSGPAHGSLSGTAPALTYTPAADYNGSDSFTFQANDGALGSNVATVSLTVRPVNDNPVANGDSATVAEDSGANAINVLANESIGPDTDETLTVAAVTQGAHGGVTFTSTGVSYTPALNYNGPDTFTYTISDGNGGSATATVSVTVTGVNDNPVASADSTTVAQGSGPNAINVLANDSIGPDTDETLTVTAVTQGAHGSVTFTPTGVMYTPVANYAGPDAFTYTIGDGNGGSATATVNVTVQATNANPVCTAAFADPKRLWPPNHRFVTIKIKGVTDPDGDAVTLAINKIWQDESTMADGSGDTPIDGIISGSKAQVRAERAGDGDGRIYEIFFTATDAKGASCASSVIVGVPHDQSGAPAFDSGVRYDSLVANGPPVQGAPPNRKPVAKTDKASTVKGVPTIVAVLANDSDPDGHALTVTAVTTPAHGTASINANGTITYTPVARYGGTNTFTYTVSDGHDGTAIGTVTVTIRSHSDGDNCEHDRHRNGRHDDDDSDHDRDTRRR